MTFFKSQVDDQLEWRSAHGPIRCANFAENPNLELKDNYTAMGCIVVITNNGSFGSLTHLDTETDIEKFVSCLDKILSENTLTSETILIGGNNKVESKSFLQNLRKFLQEHQYHITAENTGGSQLLKRHAILSHDKVTVEIFKGGGPPTIKELHFQQPANPILSSK